MKIIYFILFLLLIAGCSQKNKIPKGVLSQEKMRFVLWDLIRADEYATNFLLKENPGEPEEGKAILYEQIFKLHSTKADIFKKSLTFYQSNPNLLKVIFDSLRIDEQRTLKEQYKVETPVLDTLLPENIKSKPAL
jgi:hypothetical protein